MVRGSNIRGTIFPFSISSENFGHRINKNIRIIITHKCSAVDQHQSDKLDPDPHPSDTLDPGPHQIDKLDPDPHQFANDKIKCMDEPI